MKLYEVTNGYIGESYVRCLVVADNEAQAMGLARPAFLADPQAAGRPDYAQNLKAALLCGDLSAPWVGAVTDG